MATAEDDVAVRAAVGVSLQKLRALLQGVSHPAAAAAHGISSRAAARTEACTNMPAPLPKPALTPAEDMMASMPVRAVQGSGGALQRTPWFITVGQRGGVRVSSTVQGTPWHPLTSAQWKAIARTGTLPGDMLNAAPVLKEHMDTLQQHWENRQRRTLPLPVAQALHSVTHAAMLRYCARSGENMPVYAAPHSAPRVGEEPRRGGRSASPESESTQRDADSDDDLILQ